MKNQRFINRLRQSALLVAILFATTLAARAATAPTYNGNFTNVTVLEDSANTTFNLNNYFNDATNYSVTSADSAIVAASVASSTLTLNYGANRYGTNIQIVVTATGATNPTASGSFFVTVEGVPDLPTQTSNLPPVSVSEDAPDTVINLAAHFDNALGYIITNGNPNLISPVVSGQTLTLNYIANSNGQNARITVVATNVDGSVFDSFLVDVSSVPDEPELFGISGTLKSITDAGSTNAFFNVWARDVDLPIRDMDVVIVINTTNGSFVGPSVGDAANRFRKGTTPQTANTWTLDEQSPTTISNLLRGLVFLPAKDVLPVASTEDVRFSIRVTSPAQGLGNVNPDDRHSVTNTNTVVRVTSVNDVPVIADVISQSQIVFTGDSIRPFSTVHLIDPDLGSDGAGQGQKMTVTIVVSGNTVGDFILGSSGFTKSGNTYTKTNAYRGDAETALRGLAYQAQAGPLPSAVQTFFALRVQDEAGASATNTDVTVTSVTPVVTPDIVGTISGQLVNDNVSKQIFSGVTLRGTAGKVRVQIFRNAGDLSQSGDEFGEIINLSGFLRYTNGSVYTYEFDGSTDDATVAIRKIAFRPKENYVTNESASILFKISLLSGSTVLGEDNRTTLEIRPVNDLPSIIGIASSRLITDKQAVQPFYTRTNNPLIQVVDPDERGLQQLSVRITIDNPANGSFRTNSLGAFTSLSGGVYEMQGTSSNLSAAMRNLVFEPIPNLIPVGQNAIVKFTVQLDDQQGQQPVINDLTKLIITSENDTPLVDLGTNHVIVEIGATNTPFAAATIEDVDAGSQELTVVLSLDNPNKGDFASLGGFARTGDSYTFIGTAADAQASLQGLEFNPNVGFSSLSGASSRNVLVSVLARDSQNAATNATATFTIVGNQKTFIVTTTDDFGPGSLRDAVERANNNDQIVFSLPMLPAVIRLTNELPVGKNLAINGPGADRLTISGDADNDGIPDTRIFEVTNGASLFLRGMTLTKGTHSFAGGAVSVGPSSHLIMEYCAVTHCTAGQWGGAIDVDQGSLQLLHSLIYSNQTSSSLGQGGGGVSLYSTLDCVIANTTFSANRQNSLGGYGGGALYLENSDSGTQFSVRIANCTFKDNYDITLDGTSIKASVFNLVAFVDNTIVSDGSGANLEVDGGALILSAGGNISDDQTRTVFSQGGAPVDLILFDNPLDRTNVVTGLGPLADNGGPTKTHALLPGSIPVNRGITNEIALDQRGFYRTNRSDSGAFELGVFNQFVINEILFNPTNGPAWQFIEFYNSRDSETNDIGGFHVLVDGTLRHTFNSSNSVLAPGVGMILRAPSNDFFNAVVPDQVAAGGLNLNTNGSLITLLDRRSNVVLSVFYYGQFDMSTGAVTLIGESVNLTPEFFGWSYVPHSLLNTNGLLFSPGYAAFPPVQLGPGNAPPFALNDATSTTEDVALTIDVLGNDIELDRLDNILVTNLFGNFSNATVTIDNTPRGGASITFDPTTSQELQSLPVGAETTLIFQYEIIDFCCDFTNGIPWPKTGFSNQYIGNVSVLVTGVNDAPTPQADGLATTEDLPITFIAQTNLLDNDIDIDTDDDANTILIAGVSSTNEYSGALQATTTLGANITLLIRANRNLTSLTYDPRGSAILNALAVGETNIDCFYYSVVDRHGAQGVAKVSIVVTGVNDTPNTAADMGEIAENRVLAIPGSTLIQNDVDPDTTDNPLLNVVFVSTNSALDAHVFIQGTNVIYDPTGSSTLNALARKERIVDTFSYTIIDTHGGTNTNTVSITVVGVNDTPVTTDDSYITTEDLVLARAATNGLLANDIEFDINGTLPDDALSVIPITNQPTFFDAIVNIQPDGAFTFDPTGSAFFNGLAQGWTSNDTFTYIGRDYSFTFANDDAFSILANSTGGVLNVLANDIALAGVSISGFTQPPFGTVTATAGGLRYVPPINFNGNETFTYSITDGQGGTDTANVTVKVLLRELNGNLTANDDYFVVAAGKTARFQVLANDHLLPGGLPLSISDIGTPDSGGTATLNVAGAENAIDYTPGPHALPYDETFTYEISGGGSSVATATIRVRVINRSNTLAVAADGFAVLRGTVANPLHVLANDVIYPTGPASLSITAIHTNGIQGIVSIKNTGDRLLYTPPPGPITSETFEYECVDALGGSGRGTVNVFISEGSLNANNDSFIVLSDSVSNALPVLANDNALPGAGEVLNISYIAAPGSGAEATNDVSFTTLFYTPPAGFTGVQTFNYEISDGTLRRAEGTITVIVTNRAGTLAANTDVFSVKQNSSGNALVVLANDGVAPGNSGGWSVQTFTASAHGGAISLSGPGTNNYLLYSPPANFIGEDLFSYTATDGKGGTATTTVRVKVSDLTVNDDHFVALSGSTSNAFDVLGNDLLFGGATRLLAVQSAGAGDQGGSAVANGDGTLVLYSPDPNFDTLNPGAIYPYIETFTYVAVDDTGRFFAGNVSVEVHRAGSDRSEGLVTVAVVGVNDAPIITGTATTPVISDKETIAPFTNVVVADVDQFGVEPLIVKVIIDNPSKGMLMNVGGFVQTPLGTYSMTGTPAIVTASIRGMVFMPTENRITVPTIENTIFTISANDGYVVTTDANTIVPVRGSNDVPVISGTIAGLRVYNRSTIRPFYAAHIAEVDDLTLQPLTVRVTLDNSIKGFLTSLGGFVSTAPGTYVFSNATAASATAALQGLIFVPTTSNRVSIGVFETTRFTLTVNDHFAPTVTDTNTTVTAIDGLVARLQASDRAQSGQNVVEYGRAVAATRDFVAVGEPKDDHNGNSGSAFVYARHLDGSEAWTEVKKVYPPDGNNGDLFGFAVAMNGDTLVVGAPEDDDRGNGSGSVYVFLKNQGGSNQWGFSAKITPADGQAADAFGYSVSVDGNTIAVGAHGDDDRGSGSGSAYVYSRSGTNWLLTRKVTAADGVAGDDLGYSVSVQGDTLVAGAPLRNEPLSDSGAAYIFLRHQGGSNQWGQIKKLVSSDAAADDRFGFSVSIDRDTTLVGAPLNDDLGTDSGSAYVFSRHLGGSNQWGEAKKLLPAGGASADQFGFTVSLDRDNAVVGAPFDDDNGTDSGSAFLFARNAGGTNQWNQTEKFTPNLVAPNGNFGYALAVDRNTLIVGAPFDATENGTKYGAMYIFRLKFNNAPNVVNPIADQIAQRDSLFTFTVPAGTFDDPDIGDVLIYSAATAPTNALPAWLSFDSNTRTFSGTPGAPDVGIVAIAVKVTDEDDESISDEFNLNVSPTGALELWRLAHFGNAVNDPSKESSLWGDNADPDGDGDNNMVEYLNGTDPLGPNTVQPLQLTIAKNTANGEVTVKYVKRTDDSHLVYILEGSVDGSGWAAAAPQIASETVVPINSAFAEVTCVILDPHLRVIPALFRVRVATTP